MILENHTKEESTKQCTKLQFYHCLFYLLYLSFYKKSDTYKKRHFIEVEFEEIENKVKGEETLTPDEFNIMLQDYRFRHIMKLLEGIHTCLVIIAFYIIVKIIIAIIKFILAIEAGKQIIDLFSLFI